MRLISAQIGRPETEYSFAIADDGFGKHSPYTLSLLKHIGDPETDVRLMFGRVHDDVVALTNGRQSPNIYGSLGGRRYILNSTKPITKNDIQTINNQFKALVSSIESKNRVQIESLAEPSQHWSRYLDYMLDNFESIDLQLTEPQVVTDDDGLFVSSTLTVNELRSASGDISLPSKRLKSVQISSRRIENDWSPISW